LNPAIATTAFVLDNSVLCGWFLANQATPYSDAVAGLLPVVDAHATVAALSRDSAGLNTLPQLAGVSEGGSNTKNGQGPGTERLHPQGHAQDDAQGQRSPSLRSEPSHRLIRPPG
jgi:hypothetical protein